MGLIPLVYNKSTRSTRNIAVISSSSNLQPGCLFFGLLLTSGAIISPQED